jgi:hypothetical protein
VSFFTKGQRVLVHHAPGHRMPSLVHDLGLPLPTQATMIGEAAEIGYWRVRLDATEPGQSEGPVIQVHKDQLSTPVERSMELLEAATDLLDTAMPHTPTIVTGPRARVVTASAFDALRRATENREQQLDQIRVAIELAVRELRSPQTNEQRARLRDGLQELLDGNAALKKEGS